MVEMEFEKKTSEFLAWFKNLPGATFHNDIQIADLRSQNAGRGIVATADIEPDTVLFTIPRKSIICLANSDLTRKLPPGVFAGVGGSAAPTPSDDANRAQDSWTSLILAMMYEHLRRDGPSPWAPYLAVLPAAFETPMFWTPAELAELQASPVVATVGREEADEMIRKKILPVVREHADVFGEVADEEEIVRLAHRMGSTIMAYSFDLEGEDDENEDGDDGWVEDREGRTMMGMVPMADILNADAEFNAHINHSEEALVATALRKIPAGEEILNYYGPLPNGQLLRRYGYVTPKHSRYDVAEIGWDAVLDSVLSRIQVSRDDWANIEEKMKKNTDDDDEVGDDDDDVFDLERECDDPNEFGQLQGTPAVTDLPPALSDRLKRVLKAVKSVRPDLNINKTDRDRVMLEATRDAVVAKQAGYGTTLEDDMARLSAGDAIGGRLRMALEVRIGEKKLLQEMKSWIDGKLEIRVVDDRMDVDEPSAKRQRRR